MKYVLISCLIIPKMHLAWASRENACELSSRSSDELFEISLRNFVLVFYEVFV